MRLKSGGAVDSFWPGKRDPGLHAPEHRSAWREPLTRRFCADLSERASRVSTPQGRREVPFGALRARQIRSNERCSQRKATRDCVACRANQAWLGPVLPAKIYRFAITPNHSYDSRHPAPARGAYRDRHGRWAREAVDAAASGARVIAGRVSRERSNGAQTTGA
jgi:hypothetical protein